MDASVIAEMEQHLRANPAIRQAKILDMAMDGAEAEWTVAVSLADAAYHGQTEAEAIKAARKGLVKAMTASPSGKSVVPKKWLMPGELPVTPRLSGAGTTETVDEDALRAKIRGSVPGTGPLTTEDKMRRAVAMILHLPEADVYLGRTFKQLGGDSITAIELMSRLMTEDVPLRVPDVVGDMTLAQLAANACPPAPLPLNGADTAPQQPLVAMAATIAA